MDTQGYRESNNLRMWPHGQGARQATHVNADLSPDKGPFKVKIGSEQTAYLVED